jgi:hypothetical protein
VPRPLTGLPAQLIATALNIQVCGLKDTNQKDLTSFLIRIAPICCNKGEIELPITGGGRQLINLTASFHLTPVGCLALQ